MDLLFGQSDEMSENQPTLGLDDGAGLRVVKARFVSQRKFDWELFTGYDQLRVLTYSASVNAIVRMLNQFSFSAFGRDSPDQTNFPGYSSFWDTVNYNPAFQGRQMRPNSLKFPVFI